MSERTTQATLREVAKPESPLPQAETTQAAPLPVVVPLETTAPPQRQDAGAQDQKRRSRDRGVTLGLLDFIEL